MCGKRVEVPVLTRYPIGPSERVPIFGRFRISGRHWGGKKIVTECRQHGGQGAVDLVESSHRWLRKGLYNPLARDSFLPPPSLHLLTHPRDNV